MEAFIITGLGDWCFFIFEMIFAQPERMNAGLIQLCQMKQHFIHPLVLLEQ
jgi:hypothetical protein